MGYVLVEILFGRGNNLSQCKPRCSRTKPDAENAKTISPGAVVVVVAIILGVGELIHESE